MPTATGEKIRSRLERLSAITQAIRRHLLERGSAAIEEQRGVRQDLTEGLREGMEREALLGSLAVVRSHAERTAAWFEKALALFAGDTAAVPVLEAQLREAEEFLAWVRDLADRVAAPVPPFEESKLPPAPTGPSAEGYVGASEARARVRAGKRP